VPSLRALEVILIVVADAVPEPFDVVQVLFEYMPTVKPLTTPEIVIVGVESVPGLVAGSFKAKPLGADGATVSFLKLREACVYLQETVLYS
jgi:hypothetical protein